MITERVFGVAAIVVVLLGIVLAFVVIGSPRHARFVELDQRRTRDLQMIASNLNQRYFQTSVPSQIPKTFQRHDPVTGRPYDFKRVDARHYTLCANFSAPSEKDPSDSSDGGSAVVDNWSHPTGRTCYYLDLGFGDGNPRIVPPAKR